MQTPEAGSLHIYTSGIIFYITYTVEVEVHTLWIWKYM